MNVMPHISVQQNFAQVMESVCNDHEPVIITNENAHAVVMLSLDDYNSIEETAYLSRSPTNAARLMQAINEIENGGGMELRSFNGR